MTDVRRMLARLNPATSRFEVGSGGACELTPQDVAAALAFVPAGLGREVLCALWWPEGARLSREALNEAIAEQQRAEFARRRQVLEVAQLELHCAEEAAFLTNRVSIDARVRAAGLRAKADRAKDQVWPWRPEMHVVIRRAVLEELARPNLCPDCGGAGEMMLEALRVVCETCEGRGLLPVSDRARAARIGRDEAAYRRTWRPMYEWLLRLLSDAETKARRELASALRTCDEVAPVPHV